MPTELVLASASVARAQLLWQAGVSFRTESTSIDENAAKQRARDHGDSAIVCAQELARAKAESVSERNRDALVIGADQILVAGGIWFDKPPDANAARQQLRALRGQTHELATAACVIRNGTVLWQGTGRPQMTMRRFSDAFLEDYVAAEGPALLASVGAYRLEGRGVQLFSGMSGDYFSVLGLPLIALLEFLRECGALQR